MRPKFILALFASVAVILGLILILKEHVPMPPVSKAEAISTASHIAVTSEPPAIAKKVVTPEERQAAIDAEIDRLSAWQMNSDPQSLSNILGDLISPEKEIRDAAIEATKQFDDTNAIPVLKAVAANTQDTEEQIALLEAADFLSLPPLPHDGRPARTLEQMKAAAQKAKASGQARSQTDSSPGGQNQSP